MAAGYSWPDKKPRLAVEEQARGGGVIMVGGPLLQQGSVSPLSDEISGHCSTEAIRYNRERKKEVATQTSEASWPKVCGHIYCSHM